MRKCYHVALYEYLRNVSKKSFLIMLLSVPYIMAVTIGVGLWIEKSQRKMQPIGIVDQASLLGGTLVPPGYQYIWEQKDQPLEIFLFQTSQEAMEALEQNQIQAYFILPEHYRLSRQVDVVYLQQPGDNAWQQVYDVLRLNLLNGHSPAIVSRIVSGTRFVVRSIDGRREVPESDGHTFGFIFPMFTGIAFLTMLLMGSRYMLSAVADEKENRLLEVLVTIVSPLQLMAGKLLGIIAISLTLLIGWAIIVAAGIFVSQRVGMGWFSDLTLDWHSILTITAVSVPAYALATILMISIGVLVTTTQEAQSISSIVFACHFAPFYVSYLFIKDPSSPLAVLLSVLPFTSLMTLALRNLFTIVPLWQVLISIVVQVLCVLGVTWLASRAFQLGMLRYGKRTTIMQILGSR